MTVAEISQFIEINFIKDHPQHIQGMCTFSGDKLCTELEWIMSWFKI